MCGNNLDETCKSDILVDEIGKGGKKGPDVWVWKRGLAWRVPLRHIKLGAGRLNSANQVGGRCQFIACKSRFRPVFGPLFDV